MFKKSFYRFILVVFLLLGFTQISKANNNSFSLQEISFSMEKNNFDQYSTMFYGFKANLGWKYFSFNYQFGMGMNEEGNYTYHLWPGAYILGLALASASETSKSTEQTSKDDSGAIAAFLIFLIPEGFDLNIPMSDYFTLTFYLNWSGIEIGLKKQDEVLVSYGLGLRLNFLIATNFLIGPYIGFKGIYEKDDIGWVWGINIGAKW